MNIRLDSAKSSPDFRLHLFCLFVGLSVYPVPLVSAGPPFITDDPEPVEYRHWEIYVASQLFHDSDGWSGTAPHLEINYGIIPEVQLHLIAPLAFSAPDQMSTRSGFGDMELGVKYRFVQETPLFPQIGVFPLVELPTGDQARGLGNGETQVFLPVWFQKSWGAESRQWTTYGGGGYWINPGAGNRDWTMIGWLLQHRVADSLTIGAEAVYGSASEVGGESDIMLNAGGIFDINETYHLLFSAGNTIQGPARFSTYVALQVTFGPDK